MPANRSASVARFGRLVVSLAVIVLLVVGFVALLGGVVLALVLLVLAAITLGLARTAVQRWLARIRAGETIRTSALTPGALAAVPPNPAFAVTPPGQPPDP